MTKEEEFKNILKESGPMNPDDRSRIAHLWFDTYKNEFHVMSSEDKRNVARLYTLIRDEEITTSNDSAKAIVSIKAEHKTNIDAQRLCSIIEEVMGVDDGTEEHFQFIWRAAAIPCSVTKFYENLPASEKTGDMHADVQRILANL